MLLTDGGGGFSWPPHTPAILSRLLGDAAINGVKTNLSAAWCEPLDRRQEQELRLKGILLN